MLLSYCLFMSPFLTFLSQTFNQDAEVDSLGEKMKEQISTAAICNFILFIESIMTLITIIKRCQTYGLYRLSAYTFVIGRLFVAVWILCGMLKIEMVAKESQEWRVNLYALILSMLEIMIVILQMGTMSRLRRKITMWAKECS